MAEPSTGDRNSYDPDAVPVQPAATVMVLGDRPGLQVLMVRRAARLAFAADSWVFPGGRVDPDDLPHDINDLCAGLTDEQASQILDVTTGGLAWWMAACRETFEETGLLLARSGGDSGPLTAAGLEPEAGEPYVDMLRRHSLVIDAPTLQEVARFITPLGPPRRYDARFFVTDAGDIPGLAADGDSSLGALDEGEVTDCQWFSPDDMLARWQSGELQMMSPTVRMVACLTRYRTAAEVLETARRRPSYQRVRVEDPEGAYRVLLPGEPGYEDAELEVESGWVRL